MDNNQTIEQKAQITAKELVFKLQGEPTQEELTIMVGVIEKRLNQAFLAGLRTQM